jgi:hypothetical protein
MPQGIELTSRQSCNVDKPQPLFPFFMNERQKTSSAADPGLRKMLMWVAITLVLTVALAAVVVELTLRWFAQQ